MRVLVKDGQRLGNGALFGYPISDMTGDGVTYTHGSGEHRALIMNTLHDQVVSVALALDIDNGRALATTWCFRALQRLGIVERDHGDSDIPCESWQHAMDASFKAVDIVAAGVRCGTIGCGGAPLVVIEHGPFDEQSRDIVCWACTRSYAERPDLAVVFRADAVHGAPAFTDYDRYDAALREAVRVGARPGAGY